MEPTMQIGMVAAREVVTAIWGDILKTRISTGKKKKPPPPPTIDPMNPTNNPRRGNQRYWFSKEE
jgi:hypothetical protein